MKTREELFRIKKREFSAAGRSVTDAPESNQGQPSWPARQALSAGRHVIPIAQPHRDKWPLVPDPHRGRRGTPACLGVASERSRELRMAVLTRSLLSLTATCPEQSRRASGSPTMTICGSPLPGLPTIALAAVGVDPTALKLRRASFNLHGIGVNAVNGTAMYLC